MRCVRYLQYRTQYCEHTPIMQRQKIRFFLFILPPEVDFGGVHSILQYTVHAVHRLLCDKHDALLGVYTVRSSDRPTQATSDCLSDQSDRPVGQTVAEPLTSVNQINVAC